MSLERSAAVRPSVAYYLSMAGGCLGLMFTIFTLTGLAQARQGHDPVAGMSGLGTVGFAFSYTPAFVMRLLFWPKATEVWRACARTYITAVFVTSILGTAAAAFLLLTGPAGSRPGFSISDLVMAAVCQIGALAWLTRFRGEGSGG